MADEGAIKRRPAAKMGSWRSQFKKLRQSAGQAQQQPLGSIPENVQQPVTLEDLANMTAPMQGSPVSVNPATPSDHPENAHEQQTSLQRLTWTMAKQPLSKEALQPQT